jgi:hypothetical protein
MALTGPCKFGPSGENLIGLPIGAFSDRTFPPPVYSLWQESKLPWVGVPITCQTFDRQLEQW